MSVSIICPVYNTAKYLNQTIQSVLGQTYDQWELLLVIDAKSSDESESIAESWSLKDHRILVLKSPFNLGVANNRNHGIRRSTGKYIAFLDSDDLWLPKKLESQVQFMQNKDSIFSCHSYGLISENGSPLPQVRIPPKEITYSRLLKSNCIGCLTVMIRTDILKQYVFIPDLPHEDFIMWLTILEKIHRAEGLNENLALYRIQPNSRSGNKKLAALNRWYLYRKTLELNLFKSVYYFICYAFLSIFQRI